MGNCSATDNIFCFEKVYIDLYIISIKVASSEMYFGQYARRRVLNIDTSKLTLFVFIIPKAGPVTRGRWL